MSYLPERGYRRVLVTAAYGLIGAAVLYLFMTYLLRPLLPFFLAWGIAMLIRPAVRRVVRRTGWPAGAVAFVILLLVFLFGLGLLSILIQRIVIEMRSLSEDLMADAADAVGELFDSARRLIEKLPFLERIEDPEAASRIRDAAMTAIEEAVSRFSARIPEAAVRFITSLPGILLFTAVTVAASFYMSAGVDRVNAFLLRLLPEEAGKPILAAKARLAATGVKYVKAYLMILFITFCQLLIGFLILKIPYALTLAAVIALIDILPVLGVGTVLIPWALVLLWRGEVYTAVGLLLVFGVITVVRQVIEPKIVGRSIGLPPLVTLITMYAGYRLLGFFGLFAAPFGAILLRNLFDAGILRRPGTADPNGKTV